MDRLPDFICPEHIILPTSQPLTHPPVSHSSQIRNLSVIINIFHLLISKIWACRLKFQNVTKIGGFNSYYFTTELLQLLCNWSPYFLSIPLQSILNVLPEKKSKELWFLLLIKFQSSYFPQNKVILSLPLESFLNQALACLVFHSGPLTAHTPPPPPHFVDFNVKTE